MPRLGVLIIRNRVSRTSTVAQARMRNTMLYQSLPQASQLLQHHPSVRLGAPYAPFPSLTCVSTFAGKGRAALKFLTPATNIMTLILAYSLPDWRDLC